MDYPVIYGYNQINAKINGKAGLAISLFFPIGFPVYLLATYQRKLLRHDIKMVQKTIYEQSRKDHRGLRSEYGAHDAAGCLCGGNAFGAGK